MLIYGFHPVREALRHRPHDLSHVLVGGAGRSRKREIEELCRRHGVTLEEVSERRLEELTGGVHNGFAAELSAATTAASGGDPDLIVLVEDVQDPRNLGALLRVCEGAGVGRVVIRDRGSAPLSDVAIKASAGASEWLAIERITNSTSALQALQKDGFWAWGADGSGLPPWKVDLTGKLVLCIGGEEKGLRRLTRDRCDGLVGLPMRGRVESLNLATAAAAILYEAVRQRIAAEKGLPAGGEND